MGGPKARKGVSGGSIAIARSCQAGMLAANHVISI